MNEVDGGLASCLGLAGVHPDIVKRLTDDDPDGAGHKTLRDFAMSYTEVKNSDGSVDYIIELDKLWKMEERAKARSHRGRLHSAWLAAAAAIKNLEAATPGGASGAQSAVDPNDWEAPLHEDQVKEMNDSWSKRHDLVVNAHVRPGDPLRNRFYREFRRWALTVVDAGKMKNILHEKEPVKQRQTQVTARVAFVEDMESPLEVADIIGYYWALRTMCNAMAEAGNYEVDSMEKEGKRVLMFPLAYGLDYADRALRITSEQGKDLGWLRKRDIITRTLMANLVRDKLPAGEALKKALADSHQDWSVVRGEDVQGVNEGVALANLNADNASHSWESQDRRVPWLREVGFASRNAASTAKGRDKGRGRGRDRGGGKGGGKSGKSGKSDKGKKGTSKIGRFASVTKNQLKICGAYQRGNCGSERTCRQWGSHQCAYIVDESGNVCGSPDHGASSHGRRG